MFLGDGWARIIGVGVGVLAADACGVAAAGGVAIFGSPFVIGLGGSHGLSPTTTVLSRDSSSSLGFFTPSFFTTSFSASFTSCGCSAFGSLSPFTPLLRAGVLVPEVIFVMAAEGANGGLDLTIDDEDDNDNDGDEDADDDEVVEDDAVEDVAIGLGVA